MKWGMPSLFGPDTLEQQVDLCRELGLSFIELNMNDPRFVPERLPAAMLREITRETGIGFTVHLPEELDLASFQPPLLRGAVERCREAILWAANAGIRLLNMHIHPGIHFTLPDGKVRVYERFADEFSRRLHESMEELWQLAGAKGIRICLENTRNFHLPYIRHALERLAASGHFALTWDVGHDAKSGFLEEPVFRKHAGRVRHMHLHDFDGTGDHLPLFAGRVPIAERVRFARERSLSVVIEVKTPEGVKESVMSLKQAGWFE